MSVVEEKDRNSFYWHQKQPKLHSFVWRDLPDCKRLHTRNSLILLNRMETSWKLVKGTEIMIGRHTRLNKAWWISTQSPDLNPMDYTLLDCLCFKKCTLGGHNRPLTALKDVSLTPEEITVLKYQKGFFFLEEKAWAVCYHYGLPIAHISLENGNMK